MDHYFSRVPKSKLSLKFITALINGTNYRFATASGVFSKERIDKGTLLLVNSVRMGEGDNILDLGCGYGVIGIAFAKYADKVVMTDINERAVELAKMNIKLNSLDNVEVKVSDLYGGLENLKFSKIVCNPPIRAGRSVVDSIIREAPPHLENGGSIYLVVRTNQGAKSIAKIMKGVFGNQGYVAKSGGYRVMVSVKMDQD